MRLGVRHAGEVPHTVPGANIAGTVGPKSRKKRPEGGKRCWASLGITKPKTTRRAKRTGGRQFASLPLMDKGSHALHS